MRTPLHAPFNFTSPLQRKLALCVGATHPESAVENLRKALRLMESAATLIIRVHPADLETTRQAAPSLLTDLGRSDAVSILPDASLARGGCVVTNQRTTIDASLETQIDELVAELLGRSSVHDEDPS